MKKRGTSHRMINLIAGGIAEAIHLPLYKNYKYMEPIKITDKLTLRQEALRMALQTVYGVNVSENLKDLVIKRAEDIAEYLKGSADLPERDNAMEKYLLELKDSVLNFKNNPWISTDSEMKPTEGVSVLCALQYDSIVYEVMSYSNDHKQWQGGRDVDSTNHVVAWCPIVPFTQPLKL